MQKRKGTGWNFSGFLFCILFILSKNLF